MKHVPTAEMTADILSEPIALSSAIPTPAEEKLVGWDGQIAEYNIVLKLW